MEESNRSELENNSTEILYNNTTIGTNRNKQVIILTDSLSVIQNIEKVQTSKNIGRWTNPWIIKIIETAEKISNSKIHIGWIAAHTGILGNEIADEEAKKATSLNTPNIKELSMQEIVNIKKNKTREEWYNKLETTGRDKGSLYFHTIWKEKRKHKEKPWFFNNTKLNRREICILNRIRANHNLLKESLFRKHIIDSSACDCGGGEESVDHVIFQCPMHNWSRDNLRAKIPKEYEEAEERIVNLINTKKTKVLKAVIAFLDESDVHP
ncbi:uncharacterized protein LOC144477826 [Augochlora pura]